MIDEYIEGGSIKKSKLVMDIKKGKLSASNIEKLLDELDAAVKKEEIQNPYIGEDFAQKVNRHHWDEEYLDSLLAVATSSESFNRDYLLYLEKVASYVRGRIGRFFKKALIVILCLAASFAGGFILAMVRERKSAEINISEKQALWDEEKAGYEKTISDMKIAPNEWQKKYEDLEVKYNEDEEKLSQIASILNPPKTNRENSEKKGGDE